MGFDRPQKTPVPPFRERLAADSMSAPVRRVVPAIVPINLDHAPVETPFRAGQTPGVLILTPQDSGHRTRSALA